MKHSLALGIALLSLALGGAEAKKEQPQYPHTHYYVLSYIHNQQIMRDAADIVPYCLFIIHILIWA